MRRSHYLPQSSSHLLAHLSHANSSLSPPSPSPPPPPSDLGLRSQALYGLSRVVRRCPTDLAARWVRALLLAEAGDCARAAAALEAVKAQARRGSEGEGERVDEGELCKTLARVRGEGWEGMEGGEEEGGEKGGFVAGHGRIV